jgi:hypothetical protein
MAVNTGLLQKIRVASENEMKFRDNKYATLLVMASTHLKIKLVLTY